MQQYVHHATTGAGDSRDRAGEAASQRDRNAAGAIPASDDRSERFPPRSAAGHTAPPAAHHAERPVEHPVDHNGEHHERDPAGLHAEARYEAHAVEYREIVEALETAMERVSGRWMASILFLLSRGVRRPTQLRAALATGVTDQVLHKQLRRLIAQGLVVRRDLTGGGQRHVEYLLTEAGEDLRATIDEFTRYSVTCHRRETARATGRSGPRGTVRDRLAPRAAATVADVIFLRASNG